LHVPAGRDGRGARGDHVRAPRRGDRGVLPALPRHRGDRVRRRGGGLARRALLGGGGALLALVAGFPLLWMLSTSLKPSDAVFATPPRLVPAAATLTNFSRLLTETRFAAYFENSVIVSLATVLLTLGVSASGA